MGEYHSPGTSPFATGRSSIGQIGSPVSRLNTYRKACFVGCATALIVRPSTVMSTEICAHTPVLPVYDHESRSHVSLPNSPGSGMVWKIHRRLPVRTSYPRM